MANDPKHNLNINRDNFYLIGNQKILQFVDEFRKIIDKKEVADLIKDTIVDEKGLNSINELKYNVEKCNKSEKQLKITETKL